MVETHIRPQYPEHIFKDRVIQNRDSRDNKDLPTSRGVGHLSRFQRRIFLYTDPESVQEVHSFSYTGQVLPIQSTSIWSLHSPHGVHCSGQRGQVSCTTKGYKDPPVPRQLVSQRSHQICLQHTQTLVALCQVLGWLVNKDKSELDPK